MYMYVHVVYERSAAMRVDARLKVVTEMGAGCERKFDLMIH